MAVTLTVSQIRNALYLTQPGGSNGTGRSSTAALGTLFHQVLAGILCSGAPCSLEVVLRDQDADQDEWRHAMKTRVYDQLVGPLLSQQYATMHGQGQPVLDLWEAVQQACDHLVGLWWTINQDGPANPQQAHYFESERQIVREFHRPGWRSPVAIVGQLDAVLKVPGTSHVCLLEWKLGRTSPELDLAQACLYQLLLEGELGHQTDIAVVSFHPQRHERLFEGQQLLPLREKLWALIGELAQVSASPSPVVTAVSASASSPRAYPPPPVNVIAAPRGDSGPQRSASVTAPVPPVQTEAQPKWINDMADKLVRVLRGAGTPCRSMRDPVIGPAFARFFLFPEKGITSKKVIAQADTLHLHLELPSPPGIQVVEGTIAIDLPRPDRQSVRFRDVVSQLPPHEPLLGGTKVPVGLDLRGRWQWCDLSDSSSAHMLVVGTPGSGKSQWLRSALASLLMTNTPETLELVLIDPKQNAFQFAKDSPFLAMPLVVPGHEGVDVTEILAHLVERMGRRNAELAASNSQSLGDHARAKGIPQRRVVVICDEYADLLSSCSTSHERKDLEKQFQRIAQVGRAPGFHLILATQQPRREILNTNIRSLMSSKVTLRVTSALESNVAMGEPGAERLLGHGDLYYKCIGAKQRLQGPWLPTEEESLVQPLTSAAR